MRSVKENVTVLASETKFFTHVVANIIGNNGRVTRIVLRNIHFHLAYKVGADIGSLGVNAASNTSEEGNGTSTKAKTGEGIHGIDQGESLVVATVDGHEVEEEGKAKETKTNDGEAHDGTAGEGNAQSLGKTLLVGGLRGTDVGIGSNGHAPPTRKGRETGTGKEAPAHADTIEAIVGSRGWIGRIECHKEDEEDGNEERQVEVLSLEEGTSAGGDEIGELVHLITSTGGGLEL